MSTVDITRGFQNSQANYKQCDLANLSLISDETGRKINTKIAEMKRYFRSFSEEAEQNGIFQLLRLKLADLYRALLWMIRYVHGQW